MTQKSSYTLNNLGGFLKYPLCQRGINIEIINYQERNKSENTLY